MSHARRCDCELLIASLCVCVGKHQVIELVVVQISALS